MANPEHLEILKSGVEKWNKWRKENEGIWADLKGVDLSGADLRGIDFGVTMLSGANLSGVNLSGAVLRGVNFREAILHDIDFREVKLLSQISFIGADLCNANLSGVRPIEIDFRKASLIEADLSKTILFGVLFSGANLYKANLSEANLGRATFNDATLCQINLDYADLSGAHLVRTDLSGAKLRGANLERADFSGADLIGADFSGALLIGTIFEGSDLTNANLTGATLTGASFLRTIMQGSILNNCNIYGVSVWDLQGEIKEQKDLIITEPHHPQVTVDDIEVAQFIYLLLNSDKLRNVITAITKKGVLILGRFTPERKEVLDAMREKLREMNFTPIMFDFENAESRDFTETVKVLAGMSRFVIADITKPKSVPKELEATVPDYMIPFVPIIQRDEKPFSMFRDLRKHHWVLEPLQYSDKSELLKGFEKAIVDRALELEKRLLAEKAKDMDILDVRDFLPRDT